MALKVELKPGEKMILGNCVVKNDNQRTRLYIQGDAPILREKDILTPETADTPAKHIYLTLQMMYLDNDSQKYHGNYFSLIQDLLQAAPSTLPYIEQINNQILTGSLYKALKDARKLISYERKLIDHASSGTSIQQDDTSDHITT